MDDEEMAEEYIKVNNLEWELECNRTSPIGEVKQAYLAGLKAGKPKWHDLRKDPNDLPKRDERFSTNISIAVMTQDNGFAFYSFEDKKWYFQGKVVYVIAWCEIPTFDKE